MERKILKYGNHIIGNDYDGYMYSYNFSDGYDFNSHLHRCFEFIHIIGGKLIYTVEGTDYMLSEGDFIMTKPNELHSAFLKNVSTNANFYTFILVLSISSPSLLNLSITAGTVILTAHRILWSKNMGSTKFSREWTLAAGLPKRRPIF